MTTRFYTTQAIDKLIARYAEFGGEVTVLKKGLLGYGTTLLHGQSLKTIVIQEVYINEWSSGNTVRTYKKTPKKYLKMLEAVGA